MQEENRHPDPLAAADDPGEAPPSDGGDQEEWSSRRATWVAMGSVLLALGLIWLAPGIGDPHRITDPWFGYEYQDPEDVEAIGQMAPLDFTLQDMHGVDVELASYRGRVILLNFWATWCPPCRVEIPDLVAVQEAYGDDLVVLGLSVDDTPEMLQAFAAEFQMNYPVLVGLGRDEIQEAYGIHGLPVSVVIDRDGRIAMKQSRLASREQLERWIEPLLEAPAS
jgi:thiol-disulfide isomerase/thioredoxin